MIQPHSARWGERHDMAELDRADGHGRRDRPGGRYYGDTFTDPATIP